MPYMHLRIVAQLDGHCFGPEIRPFLDLQCRFRHRKFVDAKPFVKQNVFTSIDPKTGRPSYDAEKIVSSGKSVTFCPSQWGGKDWPPAAYNPRTRLLYVPAHENLCATLQGESKTPSYEPGKRYTGINANGALTYFQNRTDLFILSAAKDFARYPARFFAALRMTITL